MSLARRYLGFSYIGVMMTLVIAAIGMQGAAVLWQQQVQRANEVALLEIGEAYRLAIGRYYESTPQPVKQYPATLSELIEDKRFPVAKRHLRKLYTDPFNQKKTLQLRLYQGRIIGVASGSTLLPIRKRGYIDAEADFKGAKQYQHWHFDYKPDTLADLESDVLQRSFD